MRYKYSLYDTNIFSEKIISIWINIDHAVDVIEKKLNTRSTRLRAFKCLIKKKVPIQRLESAVGQTYLREEMDSFISPD